MKKLKIPKNNPFMVTSEEVESAKVKLREKINQLDWKKEGSLKKLLSREKTFFTPTKEKEYNTALRK